MIRTLIVEDEIWEQKGLMSMINWAGLGMELVAAVDNGEEAIHVLSSQHIDLVLTDMNMPIKDGVALLKYISLNGYECGVIVISGHTEFDYMRQAISSRVFDYILKPFDEDDLNAVLSKVCERIHEKETEIKHRREFQDILKISTPLLKDNLLNMLLEQRTDEQNRNILAELDKLGISMDYDGSYRVVVFAVGKTMELKGPINDTLLNEIAEAIELTPHTNKVFLVFKRHGNKEICVILGDKEQGSFAQNTVIQQFAKSAVASINKTGMVTVNIGVGNYADGFRNIHEAYHEALQASVFENLKHENKPVHFDEIKDISWESGRFLFAADKNLIKEMIQSKISSLPEFISDQCIRLRDEKLCNIADIRKSIFELIVLLEESCRNIDIDFKAVINGNPMAEVNEMNRLNTIACWLDSLTKNLAFRILNNQEKLTSLNIVEQIIRYIDDNYMQDIKLITLAQKYFINHIYLSRLFRDKTGKNFIDYLTEVRMMKASVLLKNKNLKVKDVAEMVGYDNPYYFTKRYKAFFNFTPSDN